MAASGNATSILGVRITGITGNSSSNLVYANAPTLIAPVLGAATATSINKLTITQPATSATLTIANNKTLTVSNTITIIGTDGASLDIGAGGTMLTTSATSLPSLATVGTITSGVWNGTDIAFANIAQGTALSLLGVAGNATADLAPIVAGSDFQVMRRSGTAIGFGSINLASSAAVGSSILLPANGGTGIASYTVGDILVATGTTTLSKLPMGAALNFLRVNAAGTALEYAAPSGSGTVTSVNVSPGTTGMTFVGGPVTTSGVITMGGTLAVTNGGLALTATSQGGIPFGASTTAYSILAKSTLATRYLSNTGTNNDPAWAQINLANGVTGTLPFTNLPQGSAKSVLGVAGNAAAALASIASTAANQVFRADAAGTGIGWGAINLGVAAAVGTSVLLPANGGTGQNTFTAGQVLVGTTAGGLAKTLITGTNGITVTSTSGAIAITTFNPTRQPLTDTPPITFNVTNGESGFITITNTNRTVTITNPVVGRTYILEIKQDVTGNRTVGTWPAGTLWNGGVTPVLSTIPGKTDLFSFYWNGTNYLANHIGTY